MVCQCAPRLELRGGLLTLIGGWPEGAAEAENGNALMGSHGSLSQEPCLRGREAGAPCSCEPLLGSERAQAVCVRGRAGGHGSPAAARRQKGPRQGQRQPHGTAQPRLHLEAWGLWTYGCTVLESRFIGKLQGNSFTRSMNTCLCSLSRGRTRGGRAHPLSCLAQGNTLSSGSLHLLSACPVTEPLRQHADSSFIPQPAVALRQGRS